MRDRVPGKQLVFVGRGIGLEQFFLILGHFFQFVGEDEEGRVVQTRHTVLVRVYVVNVESCLLLYSVSDDLDGPIDHN